MAVKNELKTLQNAATTTGNGVEFTVNTNTKIGVQVFGTSTACTLIAETSLDGTNWATISGIDISDQKTIVSSIATSSAAISKALEYDVERWGWFRIRLSAISNGNVTVLANML